jgi:hypothetical protein
VKRAGQQSGLMMAAAGDVADVAVAFFSSIFLRRSGGELQGQNYPRPSRQSSMYMYMHTPVLAAAQC